MTIESSRRAQFAKRKQESNPPTVLQLAEKCGLSHLFIASPTNSTKDQLLTLEGLRKLIEEAQKPGFKYCRG